MKYPLFKTPRLTGKYLERVLESGWLTTGPECATLRVKLSSFFEKQGYGYLGASRIVLAASATAGFQAVFDLIVDRELALVDDKIVVALIEATWPGIRQAIRHCDYRAQYVIAGDWVEVEVWTDIGGKRADIIADE